MSFPAAAPPSPEPPAAQAAYPPSAPPSALPGPRWVWEAVAAFDVAVVGSLLGGPLGWLWSRYAAHAFKIVLPGETRYLGDERLISGEGWYVFASLA